MPYRSDASLWFNLPGVVAAYQAIGAPDNLAARQNVAADGRLGGRHTAQPGTLPTWSPLSGWSFNGSNQYLKTGVLPNCGVGTLMLQYTAIANLNNSLAGCYNGGTFAQLIQYYNFNTMTAMNGTPGNVDHAPLLASGNYAVSGKTVYRDGVAEASTIAAGTEQATFDIYLGCGNLFGSPSQYANFKLRAALISHAGFSPATVRYAARQMAYCHVNPDWSAWGRRRRYYVAPTQAAFLAAWAARSNRLIGGGGTNV